MQRPNPETVMPDDILSIGELSRALLSNLPGGAAFVVDRDLRYLMAEGEALAIARYKPEDFVGHTLFEVLPPDLAASYEPMYRQALAGEPFEQEHQIHDRSYVSRGIPLRAQNGEVDAVLVVSHDISERKRAEEALRESEERFRLFVTASSDIVYRMSADWQEMRSLEGKRFLANTDDPSHTWLETYIPLEEQPRVWAAIQDAIRTKRMFELEHQVIQQDGSIGWTFSRAIPMLNQQGDIVEWFGTASDVTERKRTEEALRESEAKYRSLFTSMDEGYFLCDVIFENDQPIDLFYIDENPAAIRMTGQSFRGRRLREIDPNYEEYWYEIFGRVAQTGQAERLERYSKPDQIWCDFYVFKVGSDDTRQVAVVFNDITERKRAEDQLRRASEMDAFRVKLSDALRSLSDPVEIQAEACRLLGEHLGVDRAYYVEVHEAEGYARVNQHYSRGDSPSIVGDYLLVNYGWSLPIMRRGETIIITDTQTTPIIPDAERAAMAMINMIGFAAVPLLKGEVLVGALTVNEPAPREWSETESELIRETAERIWATIQRAYAEAALHESELERVREQSEREQERQRAESLAELDRAKTLFFSNISHEFRTPLTLSLAPLQDAITSLNKWESEESFECLVLSSEVEEERGESDEFSVLSSESEDKTSTQHSKLNTQHSKLQTQNSTLQTQNPITTLKHNLQLAHRNSLRLLKLVNTLLDFSRIEAGRMEAIYEPTDLATYTAELASVFRSAIEQAGLRLIVNCSPLPEPVYVDREMWEKIVLNLLSNAFKFTFEGEITVSLRTELNLDLQASTSNLHDLTSELGNPGSKLDNSTSELGNSSPELDNPSSELRVSPSQLKTQNSKLKTQNSKFVILEIRDTGTGITPEHLPHLFERFYQVRGKQARTHEGSGIGLALVHELVKLHGGTIEVNSTLGAGTCFTIALPFGTEHLPSERLRRDQVRPFSPEDTPQSESVLGHQPNRTSASTAMKAASYVEEAERWLPEGNGEEASIPTPYSPLPIPPSARVLLVDDNADMREYLTRILSEHVQVEAVADGATALAVAQEQVLDLILSDVMMPGLDGFGLLGALRADPRTREIPVILLSARAGEEAIVEGLEAGADDYLIKPFSAQELVSRVTAHLQMAQLRGEAVQQERIINRQKDEFISVVSHELNTPLVSILGWTRLLRANPSSPTMLTKALDTIERNATLQGKLVQDLLDLSRIIAGKLRLNSQPIELKPVLETAIATVTQTAAEKGIHLTWQENGTEPVVVMGDGDRLSQVFTNILTNAIKFTPEGGQVAVYLSLITGHELLVENQRLRTDAIRTHDAERMANERYAEIRVIDTGDGIPADFLPHVFDRFRQAEDANSVKGLGLGLTIARRIVELHDGTIYAESAGKGQGAIFTVRLPLLHRSDDLGGI